MQEGKNKKKVGEDEIPQQLLTKSRKEACMKECMDMNNIARKPD